MTAQSTAERATTLASEHRAGLEGVYRHELTKLVDGESGWTGELNASMRGLGLKPEDVEGDIEAIEHCQRLGGNVDTFDEGDYARKIREVAERKAEVSDAIKKLTQEFEELEGKERHLRAVRTNVQQNRHTIARLRQQHPRLFAEGSG